MNNQLNDFDQRLASMEYLVNQHSSDFNKRLKLMENQLSKYFPVKFQTIYSFNHQHLAQSILSLKS